MILKLLTERHLEFLPLKGGCTGSSESTLVKMSNCWKSHALAQLYLLIVMCTSHGEQLYLSVSGARVIQGLCNFYLSSTGKGYIGKLL